MKNAHLELVFAYRCTSSQWRDGNAEAHRLIQQRLRRQVLRHTNTLPYPTRPEVVRNRERSAQMIGVAMGDEHRVEGSNPVRPQRRGEHPPPDVETSTKWR